MRILFLSFYFQPDLSAGSFRSAALAKALEEVAGPSLELDILTTQPNRYRSYSKQAPARQVEGPISITRFALPKHRSGFFDQSRAWFAYARQVMAHVRSRQYDLVIATSSRLMTAVLGSYIASQKHCLLYLDIRDIFIESLADLLPMPMMLTLRPILEWVERKALRRASRINLVSRAFTSYFTPFYPEGQLRYIPNGIDREFMDYDFKIPPPQPDERIIVLYAGNIGAGQGLELIIPDLARHTLNSHEFRIIGDGGSMELLRRATQNLPNVKLMPPVDRASLLALYKQSHILFLHLNNLPAFKRVLPSKLFEYASTGKPILAGVAGHAADFLRPLGGVYLFPPCKVAAGLKNLLTLTIVATPRDEFVEASLREKLMKIMAADILSLLSYKTDSGLSQS